MLYHDDDDDDVPRTINNPLGKTFLKIEAFNIALLNNGLLPHIYLFIYKWEIKKIIIVKTRMNYFFSFKTNYIMITARKLQFNV